MDKKRRNFLKTTGGLVGVGLIAGTVATAFTSCEKDEIVSLPPPKTYDIDITQYPALLAVGGMAQFQVTLENGAKVTVSVKRVSDNEILVLDSICRHQNCVVELPSNPDGALLCPCHFAEFSFTNGKITKNPTPDSIPDLVEYEVYEFDKANNILKVII